MEVAEHVDARNAEGTVAAHGVAHRLSLAFQSRFAHDVTRQSDAVLVAPGTDLFTVGFHKAVGQQVLQFPADSGELALRQLPEQFRENVQ